MARIQCPSCETMQDVDDALAGQSCQCITCDQTLDIPTLPRIRKRRRRPPVSSPRYYLEAISPFGWVLIGLLVFWLGCLVLALFVPETTRGMLAFGSGLILVGNVWVGFVAYKDSHVFGMLCFFTCLFTYVYMLMNPDETWRPAGLAGVGFLFVVSAGLVAHRAGNG